MTNANDPASPVMHPTGTYSGMTIREQMALTLTAAILSSDNTCPYHRAVELGIQTADNMIYQLNDTKS